MSAAAALMLGAPIFLDLSQAGRLEYDISLVHLRNHLFSERLEQFSDGADVVETASAKELWSRVDGYDEPICKALKLRAGGISQREIALELGMSEDQVCRLLCRNRDRLQRDFESFRCAETSP